MTFAYRHTAEIGVYLAPAARGKGLGSKLLEAALAVAPQFGIDTALGFIFGHNAPSLKLFERYGFEVWGTLPRVAVLDVVERDLVIVGKQLGTGDASGA
jgi:L-amino acid N-acyltransferase YncA